MKHIYFDKYQGLGNDFILLDNNIHSGIPLLNIHEIRKLCDRRLGIGADGLLFFEKAASAAEFRMIYFNADGSRAETCFNGIRCIAKHAVRTGLVKSDTPFSILTDSDTVRSTVSYIDDQVTIEMNGPSFRPVDVGIQSDDEVIETRFDFNGFSLTGTALSLGNPHFVSWLNDVDLTELNQQILEMGSDVEHSNHFRNGTNFELATYEDSTTVLMAVWERGVGRTLACGSGATATVCTGVQTGRLMPDVPITVKMVGGSITITYLQSLNRVVVTGDAVHVFSGQIDL